jgi:hypothetical protein
MSLSFFSIVAAVVGLFLAVFGLARLFRRRWLTGICIGSTGLGILAASVILLLLASNLRTYQRLVYEMPVAQVSFEAISSKRFNAEIVNVRTGKREHYELLGDEWQLDVQVVTWHGLATLIGFDPHYRLQRISGRYIDIRQELSSQRSVHNLMSEDMVDIWSFVKDYQQWISLVDVAYGSAVYLPMVDKASYSVSISRTGLIARPDNGPAREAVGRWSSI